MNTQTRKSVHNFGGIDIGNIVGKIFEKFGKVQAPKASKSLTFKGSGERRKLPSGVWGGAPETETILNILCQNGVHFWILLISYLARGTKLCNGDLGQSPQWHSEENGVEGPPIFWDRRRGPADQKLTARRPQNK